MMFGKWGEGIGDKVSTRGRLLRPIAAKRGHLILFKEI